jgi:hypothetical protein
LDNLKNIKVEEDERQGWHFDLEKVGCINKPDGQVTYM